MILKLEMPRIDPAVDHGRLSRWEKSEGQMVDYGDEVLQVTIGEVARLGRTLKADRLGPLSRSPDLAGGQVRRLAAEYRVRVIASDRGYLRRIVAEEGSTLEVGELMALLSTDDAEAVGDDTPAPRLAFRVVTELVEPWAEDT